LSFLNISKGFPFYCPYFQTQLARVDEALTETNQLIVKLNMDFHRSQIETELEELSFIYEAVERRLANRTRAKKELETAYGEWLAKNRGLVARFEARLGQKRAVITELNRSIASLAFVLSEDGKSSRSLSNASQIHHDCEIYRTRDGTARLVNKIMNSIPVRTSFYIEQSSLLYFRVHSKQISAIFYTR
jgi:hypothetical protein